MKNSILAFSLYIFFVTSICAPSPLKAQSSSEGDELNKFKQSGQVVEAFDNLIAAANRNGKIRIIIGLQSNSKSFGTLNKGQISQQSAAIKQVQENFLSRFDEDLAEVKTFDYIPFLAAKVDAETLEKLRDDFSIVSVQEDKLLSPTLSVSTTVTEAQSAWSAGFSGRGQAIAILDSGVYKNHDALKGRVISEACYSTTDAEFPASLSLCPEGVGETTLPNSGLQCDVLLSACDHGTHVAGIAAGRDSREGYLTGVARDANIIAIKVFSRFNSREVCGGTNSCIRAYNSDVIKGLERVLVLSSTTSIAAVNLSLGGGRYTSYCDAEDPATSAIIAALRSARVATIVAAGNNRFTDALSAPACISSAISVGATEKPDYFSPYNNIVSSFSNSSPFLNLLAPGRDIMSASPGYSYPILSSRALKSGTSMAAPHVAGAWAILKQQDPSASVSTILNALITTGRPTVDARNGLTKPVIRISAALDYMRGMSEPGSIDVNGDGKTDIGLIGPAPWLSIPIAASNSDGTFTVTNKPVSHFPYWSSFANAKKLTGDFNGDGKTDFALTGPQGWLSLPIAFSNGDGSFTVTNQLIDNFSYWASFPKVKTLIGDFNNDGKTDIALTGPRWASLPIAFSNGDGSFTVTNIPIDNFGYWSSFPDVKALTGDFNGDGKTDIALTGAPGWLSLPVAFSNGDGTFQVENRVIDGFSTWSSDPNAKIFTGDFNGDGKTDIGVTKVRGLTSLPVALSNGNGTFQVVNFHSDFGGYDAVVPGTQIVTGDFNGDGKTDVAAIGSVAEGWNSNRINLAISDGDGRFTTQYFFDRNFFSWASFPGVKVLTGDFNGDGKTDIALTGPQGWLSLPVAFSNGDSSFRIENKVIDYFSLWSSLSNVTVLGK